MRRLTYASKALWHAWRARVLQRRAHRLLDAADAHGAYADMYLIRARCFAQEAAGNFTMPPSNPAQPSSARRFSER